MKRTYIFPTILVLESDLSECIMNDISVRVNGYGPEQSIEIPQGHPIHEGGIDAKGFGFESDMSDGDW